MTVGGSGGGRGRGRPPGSAAGNEAIVRAARTLFGAHGMAGSSLRSVALSAGVDPKLVTHYYRNKQDLLRAVVDLPFAPERVIPELLRGDRGDVGVGLATFFLDQLAQAENRDRLLAVIRSAASDPDAAALLRTVVVDRIVTPLVFALDADQSALRAALAGVQVVGFLFVQEIVGVPGLSTESSETKTRMLGSLLQRVLIEPLPEQRTGSVL